MKFKNNSEAAYYYDIITDLNLIIEQYGAQQVVDDLKILSLTSYEELVKIVMKADETKKQTAALLRAYNVDKN